MIELETSGVGLYLCRGNYVLCFSSLSGELLDVVCIFL